eukprot:SAG31_NODE_3579_length_4102_cov_3.565326_6_plen_492_part_00
MRCVKAAELGRIGRVNFTQLLDEFGGEARRRRQALARAKVVKAKRAQRAEARARREAKAQAEAERNAAAEAAKKTAPARSPTATNPLPLFGGLSPNTPALNADGSSSRTLVGDESSDGESYSSLEEEERGSRMETRRRRRGKSSSIREQGLEAALSGLASLEDNIDMRYHCKREQLGKLAAAFEQHRGRHRRHEASAAQLSRSLKQEDGRRNKSLRETTGSEGATVVNSHENTVGSSGESSSATARRKQLLEDRFSAREPSRAQMSGSGSDHHGAAVRPPLADWLAPRSIVSGRTQSSGPKAAKLVASVNSSAEEHDVSVSATADNNRWKMKVRMVAAAAAAARQSAHARSLPAGTLDRWKQELSGGVMASKPVKGQRKLRAQLYRHHQLPALLESTTRRWQPAVKPSTAIKNEDMHLQMLAGLSPSEYLDSGDSDASGSPRVAPDVDEELVWHMERLVNPPDTALLAATAASERNEVADELWDSLGLGGF